MRKRKIEPVRELDAPLKQPFESKRTTRLAVGNNAAQTMKI